jgi:hypothetical protein
MLRKFTQLGRVRERTAIGYIREAARKYAPGRRISDVRSVPADLRGQPLRGDLILEVPGQRVPVPRSVLDVADELGVIIRDVHGNVYR